MSPTSTGRWRPAGLWLRWSWRDLKARWIQVAAIALVIALGTGSYAGLSSVTKWRRASTDDGYARLNMHDLRVELAQGSTVPEGTLIDVSRALGDGGIVDRAEERLVLPIQVDASTADRAVLVPGSLYGVSLAEGGPGVDGLFVQVGRGLTGDDAGKLTALLERHFGKYYDLPAQGTLEISGGQRLDYVGQAVTPELFLVTTERGGLMAEANFAGLFVAIETAQVLTGREGQVNDLVLTLQPGADRAALKAELARLLAERLPAVGTTVTSREEDPAFQIIDADIDGDQQIYDIFAVLIFAGAVVAAFNLIARIVESQRREIGVAMVLGVPPWRIAIRPLLVAAEIALLGVVFGIATGIFIGQAMVGVLKDFSPLPEWHTGFQWGVFLSVGVIGFLFPFLATMWPVWRAVQVPPVQAIQAGYRAARGGGLAPLFRWVRLPGSTFSQVPVRNVVRAPRRSLLTSFGIAAAIAALIAFVGLIDSFLDTIDRGEREILSTNPDRLEVDLDRPYPIDSEVVNGIAQSPVVAAVEPQLRLGSVAARDGEEVNLQVQVLALDSPVWAPRMTTGAIQRGREGIYLSELAARNLGVGVGDSITLRHPHLDLSAGTFALVETQVEVLGLHEHPFRFVAYMDSNQAGLFNLAGATNLLEVVPVAGATRDDMKRALFPLPGVVSAQGVGEVAEVIDDLLSEFVVLLRVIEGALLVLALLIAFNSASINMDERAREHATMFAFGVRVRTVLRMAVVENLILGIVATIGGVVAGWLLLRAIIAIRIPSTVPDIDVVAVVSPATLGLSMVLGVLAVALAPLLTVRKLRRMDVPATLKVIE
jgi:putative ABC transport system permease protein